MYRILFLAAVFGAAAAQNNSELYELDILHFNDFHAHFDEVSPSGTVCNPTEAPCVGGYARLYTAVKQSLEAEPEAILLNGGDTFQGTIWYNFLRWNVSQHFMNLLPHDAHVLGNHEFDHGVEGLVPYLERLNAPMLGANVNATFEPELAKYLKNHVIITRKGRRIGIIGVLLRVFSAPTGQVIMENEVEAVNREAAILTEQGVDIIIVLSHVGFTSDSNILAHQISPAVDIIVGAHSHTLLYTGTPPDGRPAHGEYPTVVARADGHRILVVQASCYTRYLGNIKLFIDDAGVIQSWEGQPIFLGTSIIQDPEMLIELEPWRQEVDAVGREVLGGSVVALNRSWCTFRECNIGSWVCDGFLQEVMSRASNSSWNYAHVCLVNSGGLRVQINPGTITTESLLMAVPFENYVQVYDLTGEVLLQALEFSVGVNWSGSFSSGRMLQVGGRNYVQVYDLTAEVLLQALEFSVGVNWSGSFSSGRMLQVRGRNYVQVYDLTGEVLLQALEFSVGVNWSGSFSSGRMLQVGGRNYVQVYDLTGEVLLQALEFSVGVNWSGSFSSGRMLQVRGRNYVQVYDLTGEVLLQALEFSVGVNWSGSFSSGRMLQVGGRNYVQVYDLTGEVLLQALEFSVGVNWSGSFSSGRMLQVGGRNYVQVYDLTGEVLLQALEFSVGVNWSGSFSSGRMLQIGGVRVVYNVSEPIGSRVASALVRCIACAVPAYAPLDRSATYRVVTQNYIGDGGGGYTMLSENRQNLETLDVDYVMLQRFMRQQGTVVQDLDGRIQIVN